MAKPRRANKNSVAIACGCYGTQASDYGYSEERKSEILRACHERSSLRGLERTFGVARQTVAAWLKKAQHLQPLETTFGAGPTGIRSGAGRAVVVRPVPDGCGSRSAAVPGRSCPGSRATGARTVAASSGRASPKPAGPPTPAAISGKSTKACLGKTTHRSARKPDKQPVSNAGTTPCGNVWRGLFGNRWPFPKITSSTTSPCNFLYTNIIWLAPVKC